MDAGEAMTTPRDREADLMLAAEHLAAHAVDLQIAIRIGTDPDPIMAQIRNDLQAIVIYTELLRNDT